MTSCNEIKDAGQRLQEPLTTSSRQRIQVPLTTSSKQTNVAAADDFIKHWDNVIAMAKDALIEAQDRQTKYADQHRRHEEFKIGDKVLLSTKNIQNPADRNRPKQKMTPKFIGPYDIVNVISPVAYRLNLPSTLRIHPVFHVSLLKQYHETPGIFDRPLPPLATHMPDTEQEEYEVELILDKRIIRKKAQYLIKWLGYPLHDATWEPVGNLTNALGKLQEFESMRTLHLKEGRM